MNGKNVYERLEELERLLDEYEQFCGIPGQVLDKSIKDIFELTSVQLRAIPPDELGEYAFRLARWAFHLQQLFNKENTRVEWAKENIKRILAQQTGKCNAPSAEERRLLAISLDERAKQLDEIRVAAQNRTHRLAFLASEAKFMANTLLELQQTKRGKRV